MLNYGRLDNIISTSRFSGTKCPQSAPKMVYFENHVTNRPAVSACHGWGSPSHVTRPRG